ncbi:MAG: hypothetical protein K0B02_01025 [DPANN group archaeon]|nr:hypothetical protein [DPANN group archaeon]
MDFVQDLPENVTSSKGTVYTRPELFAETYLALNSLDLTKITRTDDLRDKLTEISEAMADTNITIEDINKYIGKTAKTQELLLKKPNKTVISQLMEYMENHSTRHKYK